MFFIGEEFGDELFAGRCPVSMDGLWIASDERVPFRKRFPFMHQPVGTGFRHPFEVFRVVRREHGAIGDEFMTVFIAGAAAGVHVEQAAGDAGIVYLSGFLHFELMDAALCTSIAEGFPLGGVQFVQLFGFPEWFHG